MTTCMGMIDVIMQAGVMAKILSKNPNYTPAQLKQYLVAKYVQLIIMNNSPFKYIHSPNTHTTSCSATSDKLGGLVGRKLHTPNKLLYHSCTS